MSKLQSLLPTLIDITRQAGDAVMSVYHSADLGVNYKTDATPVTLADQKSHELISHALQSLNMGPVLSEEGGPIPDWQVRKSWSQYWLVDPLDGTKEFIKRNGEFTVNIALIRDHIPVLGIVYAPATELLYYGAQGEGAFCQQGQQPAQSIHPARLPEKQQPWRIVGSRSHRNDQLENFLRCLPGYTVAPVGSSLKLCQIADGSADLYPRFGPINEWDTAAGQAVLEAAGGQMLNLQTGQPLRYNLQDSTLNPPFVACADSFPIWRDTALQIVQSGSE